MHFVDCLRRITCTHVSSNISRFRKMTGFEKVRAWRVLSFEMWESEATIDYGMRPFDRKLLD
jgi:hypothetical protein